MKHHEGTFDGIRGATIRYQYWLPENKPKALLLIVHGLAEHGGRYLNLINYFVPRGYAVYSFDHIGHGESSGRRVYVKRFNDFTSVLGMYIGMIRSWYPRSPLFLIGHSLGALISAVYILSDTQCSGAVLSGPLVSVPDNISSSTVLLSRVLSTLVPTVGIASLDPTAISRSQAVVRAYTGDPLVHCGKTTARLGSEILGAIRRVAREAPMIQLPLLVLQGGADRLVSPQGTERFFSLLGSPDKTLRVYEGLYHEIYNEPEFKEVLADVEPWLSERLSLAHADRSS